MAFEQTRHLAFFFGRVRCVCSLLRMCSGSQGGRSLEWLESGSVEARQRAAWPPKIRLMVGCGLKAPGARFFSVPSLPFLRVWARMPRFIFACFENSLGVGNFDFSNNTIDFSIIDIFW